MRIRKHLFVPRRFREEWSQLVTGPHSWLQQHTITMPSASRQWVTHCGRESLSSAAPPNHEAISTAVILHLVENPLSLQFGLSFIPPLIFSPHSSLPLLLYPALLFIFCQHTPPVACSISSFKPFISHDSVLPSNGYWWCY